MSNTVTKKILIDRIADSTGMKRVAVKQVVQEFLDQVIVELGDGNRLEFRDFGVFEVKQRAPRMAQNPKTLDPVPVPSKRTVKFKVGRKMREAMERELPAASSAEPKPAVGKDASSRVSPEHNGVVGTIRSEQTERTAETAGAR